MKQTFYIVETKFTGETCPQYSLCNKRLRDLEKHSVYDSLRERRILKDVDAILRRVNITKEEFTRVALTFKRTRKIIFIVDYFEPLAQTLHSFLGFKDKRRCNIIFTYEILNAKLSDVLYAKYFLNDEDLEESVIVISNTSSRYYDVVRRLSKTERPHLQSLVLLTPQDLATGDRLNDKVLWRGFISSAVDNPEEAELIYLI